MSAWIEGNTYENRQVLVSGRVRQPIYAAYNEPVSFTIEEAPFEDVAEWPPSSQRINKETTKSTDFKSQQSGAIRSAS